MPEREFELYLDLLGKLLKLSPEQKSAISDELSDHLEERFEELVQSGQSRDDAIRQALDEFGDAAGLAVDFTKVSRKRIRRAIVKTTAVTTAVVALAAFGFVYFGPGGGVNEGPGGGSLVNADPGDENPPAPAIDYLDDEDLFPKVLEQTTQFDFVDTPLSDAMHFLSELHEVPILIDEVAFDDVGIPLDEPLTIEVESLPRSYFQAREKAEQENNPLPKRPVHADEVPLRLALDWICRPLDLTWYVDRGLIHITTKTVHEERLIARNYDIRPLRKRGIDETELLNLIQKNSGDWEDIVGSGGRLALVDNVLSVRQTWRTHRHIATLLAAVASRRGVPYRYLGDHERHVRLLNLLQLPVTADFVDAPLPDVIEFFSDAIEARIHIDVRSLEDDGFAPDLPLTLRLPEVPLSKLCEVAFHSLGLRVIVMDGRLTLTTVDTAVEHLNPVLYDVSDAFSGDEILVFVSAMEDAAGGFWQNSDGAGGDCVTLPNLGRLLVYQTDPVHAQVREMLAWHRNTRDPDADVNTKPAQDVIQTRFYRMDRETAEDLLTLLPEVVGAGSWKSDENPKGGFIRKVAAGRRIMQVKGQALSGQGQIGSHPKQPAPPKPGEPTSSVVIPETILVIGQTVDVHKKIEKFLSGLGITWTVTDEEGRALRGSPKLGGGFY